MRHLLISSKLKCGRLSRAALFKPLLVYGELAAYCVAAGRPAGGPFLCSAKLQLTHSPYDIITLDPPLVPLLVCRDCPGAFSRGGKHLRAPCRGADAVAAQGWADCGGLGAQCDPGTRGVPAVAPLAAPAQPRDTGVPSLVVLPAGHACGWHEAQVRPCSGLLAGLWTSCLKHLAEMQCMASSAFQTGVKCSTGRGPFWGRPALSAFLVQC